MRGRSKARQRSGASCNVTHALAARSVYEPATMFLAWREVLIGCWGTAPPFLLAALVLAAFAFGAAGSLVLTARHQYPIG